MDEIINALRNLKMPGMAHYWATMQETRQAESLSLKDGLQLLIQAELDNRNQSRNARLIKKAHFRYQASISEVIYDSKRGVDKQKVLNLATCDYVKNGVSILITGAAGTGKSWLGTAFGHQACMNGKHSVNHVFLSPTSIINFTSKKQSYDDARRSSRDNELLQRAQSDL